MTSTRPLLVLTGPPGAGKTTIGRALAQRHGVPFADADHEIERDAGVDIARIFAEQGEAGFREREAATIDRLLRDFPGVLALGGGAVVTPAVRRALAGHRVVFVDVDLATALARVRASGARPLLAGDAEAKLARLMDERRPLYEEVAGLRVSSTDVDPEAVVETIVARWDEITVATRVADVRRVGVGDAYDVLLGRGLDDQVARAVDRRSARVLVVHPASVEARARSLAEALRATGRTVTTVVVPDGEAQKTFAEAQRLWDVAAEAHLGREDTVVGLGGGATTDLAGFVAACWLRGVRLVQVPTTLLGMVDAAVGGKTGVNTEAGKNLVGAFHSPDAVVCDLDALTTLPERDLRAGLGEVVKCGFIADPVILDLVEADPAAALDPDGPVLVELVERSVAVKARVVAEDLHERGLREILNYGHTYGHAVEKCDDYGVRHGEAVALGMVFAAELAVATGHLHEDVARRHRDVLRSLGLPTSHDGADFDALRAVMAHDKKRRGDDLRFVVLDDVALPALLVGPSEADLRAADAAVRTGVGR